MPRFDSALPRASVLLAGLLLLGLHSELRGQADPRPYAGTTPPRILGQSLFSDCDPAWLPTFGGQPDVSGWIRSFTVFDDGGGPALYVGGHIGTAGGMPVNGIAQWDGASWLALDEGSDFIVLTAAVFDDGGGPALYAGGPFTTAGGVPANGVARWDGSNWTGLDTGADSRVTSLEVFDDGTGPALYASGIIIPTGSTRILYVAKWNGTIWSAVGSELVYDVVDFVVFDDGHGPALYAGGSFNQAQGAVGNHIAKWDGTNWSGLGSGLDGIVNTVAVFDDGGGPALYAGGWFTAAGSIATNRVAKWDGTSWTALGSGMNGEVAVLSAFDDGSGEALYAGGAFTTAGSMTANKVAKWNGTSWSALGNGLTDNSGAQVRALGVFDDGSGPALFAGGFSVTAGGVIVGNFSRWDGTDWISPPGGLDDTVRALAVHDDGSGPKLRVAGPFTTQDGVKGSGTATWDGARWSALGDATGTEVGIITVFDDGTGPALHAGGTFTTPAGVATINVAKWNGSNWSPLGSGMSNSPLTAYVAALTAFDDGSGPALIAGGIFHTADGVPAYGIAKWDGSRWSALGSGIFGVNALISFDDGSGPALYAGGFFESANGMAVNHVARWNGTNWMPLGAGLDNSVFGLGVFDDGTGPALYAGGVFMTAGGVPAARVAKWDGSAWSALGNGVSGNEDSIVRCLTAFDDGGGPALYAGGTFSGAGDVVANHVAKWNGTSWCPLGGGLLWGSNAGVFALQVFDDGQGPALYVGGSFTGCVDSHDSFLARWGGCPAMLPTWTNLGFALPGTSGAPVLSGAGELTTASSGSLTLSHAAPSTPSLLCISVSSTPSPFQCGTLVPVPVLTTLALTTDPIGEIPLVWPSWPAGLSGLSLYFQYAVKDAAAVCGVALSNALRADVP